VAASAVLTLVLALPRTTHTPLPIEQAIDAAADLLALRMLQTWAAQARQRGIEDRAPVRVRWIRVELEASPTSPVLDDGTRGHDEPAPLPDAVPGQVLSSGLVTRLHDRVYAKLQHGRLVITGPAGAGKTAAMILLMLEALERRSERPDRERPAIPVPVWLALGSWDPRSQPLGGWVEATIARDHPYLRATEFGPGVIAKLLLGGRLALFLDGLDEMPDALRPRALERLAEETVGLRMVLTSRPDEYAVAIHERDLPYATVVHLQPVGPVAAAEYLLADKQGEGRLRWQQVAVRLKSEPDGVLARVLSTPLMLSLARGIGPDPRWLLSAEIPSEQDLRRRLLDHTLVVAYPEAAERHDATHWLSWIAYNMSINSKGNPRDLAWWQIPWWTTFWPLRLLAAATGALATGLVQALVGWLMFGLAGAVVFGLVGAGAGLPVGVLVFEVHSPREMAVRWPTAEERRLLFEGGLTVGLMGGLFVGCETGFAGGLVFGVTTGRSSGLTSGVSAGVRAALEIGLEGWLVGGLVVGLIGGFGGGLVRSLMDVWSRPVIASAGPTPISVYRQGLRVQVVGGLVFGSAGGLIVGLVTALVAGPVEGLLAGVAEAVLVGLVGSLSMGAAPSVWLMEAEFRARGRRVKFLPLLETALQQQVLRQAGAVYQFRHAELQDRLEQRYRSEELGEEAAQDRVIIPRYSR